MAIPAHNSSVSPWLATQLRDIERRPGIISRAKLLHANGRDHNATLSLSRNRYSPRFYQISFAAIWICRELVDVPVTTPADPEGGAVAEVNTIKFGVLKFVWFKTLKNFSP